MRLGRRSGLSGVRRGRWHSRVARGLWPDRNPLRRTCDRAQTYLLAGLFLAAAAGAPVAAEVASHAAYAASVRAEQAQLGTVHQVRAVLTRVATSAVNVNVVTAEVPVDATWTSVTGAKRTGQVLAPPGTQPGRPVMVWTDNAGDLTSPPLQPSQMAGQADLAAAGAVTRIGLLFLCGAVLIRHVLYRGRMAAWEAEWVVTARAWNRQRW
jgi:hypothetical protein